MARLSSLLPQSASRFDFTRLPKYADVQFRGGHWHLRIKWAKANQETESWFWVPLLPRQGSPACPVTRWAHLLQLSPGGAGTRPLFWVPRVDTADQGADTSLTMSMARAWLLTLLTRLGRHKEGFMFHSFCRGACTSAFLRGASEQDIRSLGGWRSEAVRCYLPVEESRRRTARALATSSFSNQQITNSLPQELVCRR